MQKIDIESLILKILYGFAGAIVCLQVIHMDRYVSFCFYATFYLTLAFWISCTRQKTQRLELWILGCLIIALINVLINAAISGTTVTMQYLKKLLSFLAEPALKMLFRSAKEHPDECRQTRIDIEKCITKAINEWK